MAKQKIWQNISSTFTADAASRQHGKLSQIGHTHTETRICVFSMCLCSFWPVYLSIYLYFTASTWVCVCLCFGFGFSFAFASILSSENYAHLVSRLTTPAASGRTWRMCDMITKCLPSVCLPCAYVCMCVCSKR